MSPSRSRQVICVLVAFAVGAGSLLIAGSALADTALFRVEQSWHNYPNPPVTTPGNAGLYVGYIQPYVTKTPVGKGYFYPPATAIVQPGNPIGGWFTLPTGWYSYVGKFSITSETGWEGYSTVTYVDAYNGPGKFGPDKGSTATNVRVVFPTTGGNPYPNWGYGAPTTTTPTFGGLYGYTRGGSINVEPGERRFGGTMRLFYGPTAGFYQDIWLFDPAFYKAYGYYHCLQNGNFDCTKDTFVSNIGDITALYQIQRFLLNVKGTGTGNRVQDNTAKATTAATPYGKVPTYGGEGTPTYSGPASYVTAFARYLNMAHPWTTGFAIVHNPKGDEGKMATPQKEGYDISLGGQPTLTVTRYDWNAQFNSALNTVTYTTLTSTQKMYDVGRVVSMVRPRIIHTYTVPLDPTTDPITNTWNVPRIWAIRVFFLPEPMGMLLLGAGIAVLLGLSRMRRR